MRNLLTALVVVGLLAAPSFGLVNVKLVAVNPVLNVGDSTVVQVWGQGTAAGLFSMGGYITATGAQDVLTSQTGMSFDPLYSPTGLFTPKSVPGTANYAKGGFGDLSPSTSGFGSEQTDWGTPDATMGKDDYVLVSWYTVKADVAPTAGPVDVTLHFNTKTVSGYKPLEVDKTGVLGLITDATITVVPEPMTMVLLALGGLAIVRRHR